MEKAVVVGRPINGIALNGLEYLLDDEGGYLVFENKKAAVAFLEKNGCTAEEMEEFIFRESIGTCFRCRSPLFKSDIKGYTSQCFHCDEDFYSFEQETVE